MTSEPEEVEDGSHNLGRWREAVVGEGRLQPLTEEVHSRTAPFIRFTEEIVGLSIPKVCHNIDVNRDFTEILQDYQKAGKIKAVGSIVEALAT